MGRSVVHSIGENGGIEVEEEEEEEEEEAFEFRPKKEEGTLLDCIEGKGGEEEDWEEKEKSATARNRFATL